MASGSDTVSTITLYAELLFHIRAVSFITSLQTNSNKTTRAELSADGEHINLTHDGEVATIRLPTKIAGGGSAVLTLPAAPSKELTLRLQLEERSPGLSRIDGGSANAVPWCASSLSEGTRVQCRECQSDLLGPQRVSEWKDLPSESWAEMMDFWHCHKPNVEHYVGYEDAQGRKGYAASSHLVAVVGIGLVDLSYFLFAVEDCCGMEINPNVPEAKRPSQLLCSKCRAVVGVVDERAEGWRIYKWAISVNTNCSRAPTSHDIAKWLSAQLLALIDNQGVRKFVVHDDEEREGARKSSLKLWIFTPDLRFSSSYLTKSRNDPTRAMRVFWQPLSPQSEDQSHSALTQENLSVEEIELPSRAFRALTQRLEFTARLLPLSARKFQEWNVGLLERFDEHEA
ncbi:ubiquitin-conjugating enzyme E2-binding protein [Cryomyces antarcticus]